VVSRDEQERERPVDESAARESPTADEREVQPERERLAADEREPPTQPEPDRRRDRERPADDRRERALERMRERARARAILDLEEGRGTVPLLDSAGVERMLRAARRIAIIGASSRPGRPSWGIFRYLRRAGYDAVPVNPHEVEVDGVRAHPTLADAMAATGAFDIVDVFRRPEACPEHAREAVAAGARCLWLQLGIVSWEAARLAAAGGLEVVMDRCIMVDHHRLHE
jgi:predicted CoA-binding protein